MFAGNDVWLHTYIGGTFSMLCFLCPSREWHQLDVSMALHRLLVLTHMLPAGAGIDNAPGSIGYERVSISPPSQLIQQAVGAAATLTTPDIWEAQSIEARQAQLHLLNGSSHTGSSSPPLQWASATKTTTRGEFALFWRIGNGTLSVDVTVPANAVATTLIPLVGGGTTPTIVEGGKQLWNRGSYISGVAGVRSATKEGDAIRIEHGSGTFNFVVEGF
jgi:hypothetical protein